MCNAVVSYSGRTINSSYNINFEDYGWSVGNIDEYSIFAIKDVELANAKNVFNGVLIEEPGIYACYLNMLEDYKIQLPIHREYEGNFSVNWNNISGVPFGRIHGKRIVGGDFTQHDSDFGYKKQLSSSEEIVANFYRFYCIPISSDEIIGSTLLLNDGTTKTVTEDILLRDDENDFWEIENLLFSGKNMGWDDTHWEYIYRPTTFILEHGVFTSDATGVYVKEIIFPDEIRKIDPELIPDEIIPSVEGLASEEYVDNSVAQAKEYTDSQRLGYSSKPVYTFNGDVTGKVQVDGYVKISDDTPDLTQITKVAAALQDGSREEITGDSLTFTNQVSEYGWDEQHARLNGQIVIIVISNSSNEIVPSGLYVVVMDGAHVSKIEFSETIHPIPAEYIPGTFITDEEADALIASII